MKKLFPLFLVTLPFLTACSNAKEVSLYVKNNETKSVVKKSSNQESPPFSFFIKFFVREGYGISEIDVVVAKKKVIAALSPEMITSARPEADVVIVTSNSYGVSDFGKTIYIDWKDKASSIRDYIITYTPEALARDVEEEAFTQASAKIKKQLAGLGIDICRTSVTEREYYLFLTSLSFRKDTVYLMQSSRPINATDYFDNEFSRLRVNCRASFEEINEFLLKNIAP